MINASHVIEHLTDPLVAIMEMHRILKSNGKITIRVPHKDGFFACAIGHFHYFSMQWFENLKGLNCQQNDIGNDKFKNHSIYLNMFVPRVPWSPLVQFLIHRWEKYFNKNRSRQLAWEVLGIFHPGEIVWKAQKF